jgi:ribosomal protein S18 acetylase RimI-like enzyme
MQPVSPALLELCVYSKPYFDRNGLIVAVDDDMPVGFVHASFGPNEEQTELSTELGTTQMLQVRPDLRSTDLPRELMLRSEAYLRERGAKVLYAGGIYPLNGFYLGLYGGSELPGVLASDRVLTDAALQLSYRETSRVVILQRDLVRFRPPISREQRALRRDTSFQLEYLPTTKSWWEACTLGPLERWTFTLTRRNDNLLLAEVWFWDVEPLATSWGLRTAGMVGLYVDPSVRRQGCATFLLSEAFAELNRRGYAVAEAQVMADNTQALAFYERLGFVAVEQGHVYRKE